MVGCTVVPGGPVGANDGVATAVDVVVGINVESNNDGAKEGPIVVISNTEGVKEGTSVTTVEGACVDGALVMTNVGVGAGVIVAEVVGSGVSICAIVGTTVGILVGASVAVFIVGAMDGDAVTKGDGAVLGDPVVGGGVGGSTGGSVGNGRGGSVGATVAGDIVGV